MTNPHEFRFCQHGQRLPFWTLFFGVVSFWAREAATPDLALARATAGAATCDAEGVTDRGRSIRSVQPSRALDPVHLRHSATPQLLAPPTAVSSLYGVDPRARGVGHAPRRAPQARAERFTRGAVAARELGETRRDEKLERRELLATAVGVHAVFKSLRTVRRLPRLAFTLAHAAFRAGIATPDTTRASTSPRRSSRAAAAATPPSSRASSTR